jgi:hypothetical protein
VFHSGTDAEYELSKKNHISKFSDISDDEIVKHFNTFSNFNGRGELKKFNFDNKNFSFNNEAITDVLNEYSNTSKIFLPKPHTASAFNTLNGLP